MQRIRYNGTQYPERAAGQAAYGTFYSNVKPIDSGNTTKYTPTLYYLWGSRIAEMSGRVRGLAGIATMKLEKILPQHTNPDHGTARIDFPPSYFSHQPIVKAMILEYAWFDKPRFPWLYSIGDPVTGYQDYTEQAFAPAEYAGAEGVYVEPANNIWWTSQNYGAELSDPRRRGQYGEIWKSSVTPIIFVCQIGSLGFTVISQRQSSHAGYVHAAQGRGEEYEYIAWHAFGL